MRTTVIQFICALIVRVAESVGKTFSIQQQLDNEMCTRKQCIHIASIDTSRAGNSQEGNETLFSFPFK